MNSDIIWGSFGKLSACLVVIALSWHTTAEAAAAADPADAVARAATKANTGGSALQGIANGLTDLIPNLQLLVGDNDIGEDGSLQRIGAQYSPDMDGPIDLAVSVVFERSTPFAQLKSGGLITDAQEKALGNELQLGDNHEITLTASYMGPLFGSQYGRNPHSYQQLLSNVVGLALTREAIEQSVAFANRFQLIPAVRLMATECALDDKQLDSMLDTDGPLNIDAAIPAIRKLPLDPTKQKTADCDAKIDAFEAILRREASDVEQAVEANRQELEALGVFNALELISKAPQLLATATYTNRDAISGPKEYRLKLLWESGESGDAPLMTACPALSNKASFGLLSVKDKASCYSNLRAVRAGRPLDVYRWSLSAEYKRAADYHLKLSDPATDFRTSGGGGWAVNATAAWTHRASSEDANPYVFEASLAYEDSSISMKNDRALFTVSATRNLAEGVSATLGIRWANRPEFRGEVDHEVSGKFGLTYKI